MRLGFTQLLKYLCYTLRAHKPCRTSPHPYTIFRNLSLPLTSVRYSDWPLGQQLPKATKFQDHPHD